MEARFFFIAKTCKHWSSASLPAVFSSSPFFFQRELGLPQCNGASARARHCDRTWHRSACTDFEFRPSTRPAVHEPFDNYSDICLRIVIPCNTSNISSKKNDWMLWDRLNCSAGKLKVLYLRYYRGSLQGLWAPRESHG